MSKRPRRSDIEPGTKRSRRTLTTCTDLPGVEVSPLIKRRNFPYATARLIHGAREQTVSN